MRHLVGSAKEGQIACRPEPVGCVEIAPATDGRKDVGEDGVAAVGVVHVVRCHGWQVESGGDLCQDVVACVIIWEAVAGELDEETAGEDFAQPCRCLHRPCQIPRLSGPWHGPLTATGEGMKLATLCRRRQIFVAIDRSVLLPPVLAAGDEPADRSVPGRVGGQQHEVVGRG